jgi:hypothetical protein
MLSTAMTRPIEQIELENSLKYSEQRANGVNVLYVLGLLIGDNFKNLKREIIFFLHIHNLESVYDEENEKFLSDLVSNEDLINYLLQKISNKKKLVSHSFIK